MGLSRTKRRARSEKTKARLAKIREAGGDVTENIIRYALEHEHVKYHLNEEELKIYETRWVDRNIQRRNKEERNELIERIGLIELKKQLRAGKTPAEATAASQEKMKAVKSYVFSLNKYQFDDEWELYFSINLEAFDDVG